MSVWHGDTVWYVGLSFPMPFLGLARYAIFKRSITVELSVTLRLESGLKSHGSADRCGESPLETINFLRPPRHCHFTR